MMPFIDLLQALTNEGLLMAIYLSSILSLYLCYRYLGSAGAILFCGIGIVLVNIQVLKIMSLRFFEAPVAMGTTLMMVTFLATDMLVELDNKKTAQKAVYAGFIATLFTTIIMLLTQATSHNNSDPLFLKTQEAITTLFTPTASLFIASLGAYLTSQLLDVSIFATLKNKLNFGGVFLRSFISTAISSLVDTIVFSVLAWRVFAVVEIDTHTLIYTYILGTYSLRVILSLTNGMILHPLVQNLKKHKSVS